SRPPAPVCFGRNMTAHENVTTARTRSNDPIKPMTLEKEKTACGRCGSSGINTARILCVKRLRARFAVGRCCRKTRWLTRWWGLRERWPVFACVPRTVAGPWWTDRSWYFGRHSLEVLNDGGEMELVACT